MFARDHHADAGEQRLAATERVDDQHRGDDGEDREQLDEALDEQRRGVRPAELLEDRRAVVGDRVDAGDLHEEAEHDHEDGRAQIGLAQHRADLAAALGAQVGLDVLELALDVRLGIGAREGPRASSMRPFMTYQRGVSGSRSSTISTSAAGIAEIASIQRQCSPPASAQATK